MLWTHFPNTHCTCHSSHSQLFPIITDYLYNSLPPLCLFVSDVYVFVTVVCTLGIHVLCCLFLYPSLLPVLFFAVLAFCSLLKVLPAIGPIPHSFHGLPHRAVTLMS